MARERAGELLEQLGSTDAADRLVRTYSGGMRRRLDLAASLVARPPVLFLDEPTTGLDPQSRNDLWELLGELVARRHDARAHDPVPRGGRPPRRPRSCVLDHGRVAATGTPAELKARVGGERIVVTVARRRASSARPRPTLAPFGDGAPDEDADDAPGHGRGRVRARA